MSNPKQKQLESAINAQTYLGKRYYGMAIPAVQFRNASLMQALGIRTRNLAPTGTVDIPDLPDDTTTAGGKDSLVEGAIRRTGAGGGQPGKKAPEVEYSLGPDAGEPAFVRSAFEMQRASLADTTALSNRAGASKFGTGLTPRDIGAEIARANSSSAYNQSISQIDQTMNLLGMGFGAAAAEGSAGMQAAQNQMNAIQMMPTVTTGTNAALGVTSGLASLYGALLQSGALSGQGGSNLFGQNYSTQMPGMAAQQWGMGGVPGGSSISGMSPYSVGGSGPWGIPQPNQSFGLGTVKW